METIKTCFLYSDAALSCDYSRSAAAMSEDVLLQIAARAVEGLREPEGPLVCSFFS